MITKFGIYKNTYNIASQSYEILPEISIKLFSNVHIKHIKALDDFLDIYKFETNDEYQLDELYRKFNIYPITVDELLGFIKKDWIQEEHGDITPEQYIGVTGSLSDLAQHKYARVALERFHMDSTSKFIVGDSFSELLKAIIIVGNVVLGEELNEEQKSSIRSSVDRLQQIYGDTQYCINKLEEYTLGLLQVMTDYKTIKNTVISATTSEEVWK